MSLGLASFSSWAVPAVGPLVGMLGAVLVAVGLGRWWFSKNLGRALAQHTGALETAHQRYRLLADHAWDMLAIVQPDGKIDYANAAFTRVLGRPREALRGQPITALFHPAHAHIVQDKLHFALAGGPLNKEPEYQAQALHADGTVVPVDVILKGLPDADWRTRSAVVQLRDARARHAAAHELAESEQRFKDFAASSADMLWETDTYGAFTYLSPGVQAVLGQPREALLGRKLYDVLGLKPHADDAPDPAHDALAAALSQRQQFRDAEVWCNPPGSAARVCLRLSGVPLTEKGLFEGFRGVATNITASKIDRDNMFRLATTDHLTGLLNRPRFKEELDRAVGLARRHHATGVVLFIDLDRFKEINDTHGHEAGDKILTGMAGLLRDAVRSTDVVARLGGDEFGVIMHNIDTVTAGEKIQALIDRMNSFGVDYQGTKLTTTMSIGMVQYPQDDKDIEYLIMAADMAMYRAKNLGRNRLFVDDAGATAETAGSVRAQLKGLERLRTCLETGDFEMHYQAIVPATKRQRPLFEALLRIYDEHGKMLSPALFIDAAEHFGLIQQLDLAVVKKVFETQATLQAEGVAVDISINLSVRTLGDPDVAHRLTALREDLGVDPNRIIFEVTETMALHDPAQMRDIAHIKAFIETLRDAGFRFALDDFGTGFTSFRYLKVLPVDLVKIDGEYVKNIAHDVQDQLFVKGMADLCKGLGIATIAEFVEDAAAMHKLAELGVDYGQGWHFAKPAPDLRALAHTFTGKTYAHFEQAGATQVPLAAPAPTLTPMPAPATPAPKPTKKTATSRKARKQ